MQKKFVEIQKERFAYIDEGEGEVLLLIHGNMSSSVHFKPLIERLSGSYRCVAPDMRGFGDSSYNNRFDSLEELAEDIAAFMDGLGIVSAYVAGWSTGGGVALKLAANYPEKVKKLFLIESAGLKGYPIYQKENYKNVKGKIYSDKEEMAKDPVQVAPPLTMLANKDTVSMSALWDMTIYTVNKPTREDNDLYMSETVKQRNLIDVDWALANFNMSEEHTAYCKGDGSIKRVKCPVALTLAQNDFVVPDYMVMDNYNGLECEKQLLVYRDCGHSPLVDCPDKLAEDLKNFFNAGKAE